MISNITRTAGDLYEEFVFRASTYRTRENIDFDTAMRFINNAIKELYTILLPYKEFAYHKSITVQNGSALPRGFYKDIRLLIKVIDGDVNVGMQEARRSTPQEYWTATNWHNGNKWTRAKKNQPVYTIWNTGVLDNSAIPLPTPTELRIFISPNLTIAEPTPPIATELEGILEYYGLPNDMTFRSQFMDLPAMFEEFVNAVAINRFMMKSDQYGDIVGYRDSIAAQRQSLFGKLQTMDYNIERELDSFLTPVAPFRMVQQLPGEMPTQLVG